ncbi:zinc/manganese/iron ABC transporter, ATP-binding protein [Pseudooceanicola batsensis HTCC2597]|uniref:Zinc/manganese/iron ABC transporter, ATP-binding protein n=1 Tax=Pseudooceanicola batsensis (strain ATCC BAA-863 / DSM 15984 / KCTC 12145 / HTCC2597) TaxID=252305 RepID=A3TYE3_PSEBH|nr:metal ABC transporter ATP-binding protein [Pseudooceanicola batsensis]EAQ03177.1 zinc/manganese/iron ABC transporter, ATP-binding protein [Pseudooceanicola batsensis HTCC2597]
MGDAPLRVRGLTVSYGASPAVFSADMTVAPGAMTAIIGPNGAGKSTLLKAVLGIVPRVSGQIEVFGAALERQRARIAYVPQRASVDWDFPTRVIDVVEMGLYRRVGLIGRLTRQHRATAGDCLARVGMSDFATRQIGQLSGGQQQRVFLARALAQGADLYMLDEPFAGVDAATEKAIIDVLKSLKDEGRTILAVHHDLSTVPDYFDRVFVINKSPVAEGTVAQAFTQDTLQQAYGGRLATGLLDQLFPATPAAAAPAFPARPS